MTISGISSVPYPTTASIQPKATSIPVPASKPNDHDGDDAGGAAPVKSPTPTQSTGVNKLA
jgi:hypothetical protein